MLNDTEFTKIVEEVLAKYQDTTLRDRWEEAVSFGAQANAVAYWIRDSEDVINIVWLNLDGIRDITWFPQLEQSTFSFLPFRNIAAVEVREAPDIAKRFGFTVKGNLLIQVYCVAGSGSVVWVADTERQVQDLRAFIHQVFTVYTTALGT